MRAAFGDAMHVLGMRDRRGITSSANRLLSLRRISYVI